MSGNQQNSKRGLALPTAQISGLLGALIRVPVNYILEVWVDGKLTLATSLPNTPADVHIQRPTPHTIRHTLGDRPRREIAQARNRHITLSGRSGLAPRQGYDRVGDQIFASGPKIHLEFDAFLQAYTAACEEKSAQTLNRRLSAGSRWTEDSVYLVFRALDEGIHLRVEPTNWVVRRSALRSRFSYEWQLALQGYGYAPPKARTILDTISDIGDRLGEAIGLVNASIGLVANLSRNTRASITSLVGPALDALSHASIAIDTARAEVGKLTRVGLGTLARFAVAATTFRTAVDRWKEIQNPFDPQMYRPELRRIAEALGGTSENAVRLGHQSLALSGGGPCDLAIERDAPKSVLRTAFRAGTPADRRARRYADRRSSMRRESIVYMLRPGDTLSSLAARVLGDGERWREIAQINGFASAITDEHGAPLLPGRVIKIPGDADPLELGIFLRAETLDELLGVDLYLDPKTCCLQLVGTTDLRVVSGAANLEQAVTNRFLTRQGECSLLPRYGLPVQPGAVMTASIQGYLAAHLRDQALADPRVAEVRELHVYDEGDTLAASATLTPITGAVIEVIAPLRTE